MKREEIIRDLVERSFGAGRGQYISIRCDVVREIVALLKKQEAKAAWYDSSEMLRYWHCGHCGVIITHGDKYCRMCGKAVKWDD